MNISEAAKKAAEQIDEQIIEYYHLHDGKERLMPIIQSAIDAETAALREELDALKKRFAHLINNQSHDVDEYYRDEPTEEIGDLAAKDAEIARLTKIVSDCLAAMPFGNIATHTPENLPERITDLAAELARGEILNDELVEALKKYGKHKYSCASNRFNDEDDALNTYLPCDCRLDAALKKVGAE